LYAAGAVPARGKKKYKKKKKKKKKKTGRANVGTPVTKPQPECRFLLKKKKKTQNDTKTMPV
jgi:hypothetical protein